LRSNERNPLYFCAKINMMRKFIFIPLMTISLLAYGQADTLNRTDLQGKKTGYWISYDPAGKKVYEGVFKDGRPTGRFLRFHANGKVRAEMNYLQDGISVETRLFDPEGRTRAEGTYRNQLRDGHWSFYSEKKNPVYRIHYTNGKINGEAFRFDANGIINRENLMDQQHTEWQSNHLLSG
jgi:antitoxin component YwqK of YwqJK toxin-antitoxin module